MNGEKASVFFLLIWSSLFLFFFGCASDQTLIPRDQTTGVDLSNPAVSDGFDFPLPGYFPTGNRFLERNVRSLGCPLSYHPGEDVAGHLGSAIHACSNGTVVFAECQNEFSGYVVILEHAAPPGIRFKLPGGKTAEKVWSAYYHMSGIDPQNVGLNRVVKRGQRIGYMGDFPHGSGKAIHLHFEIRKVNLWKGSAYISAGRKEHSICKKPEEWITDHFVCPSDFIKLNRSR